MNVQFYSDLHAVQVATKERLAQRANTIITGLTTLSGILGFLVVDYSSFGVTEGWPFYVLACATFFLLVVSIGYLIASFRVPFLQEIAPSSQWVSFMKGLRKKYSGQEGAEAKANEEFENYVIEQYAEVADGNKESNTDRGMRLVSSNNALFSALALLVVTSLAYYYLGHVAGTDAHSSANEYSLVCKKLDT